MLRRALLICLAATVGCSDGLHPVTGIVTLDGKPVEGASVVFNPTDPDSAIAAGSTDAEGRFKLRTGESAGAAAGKYKVTVLLVKTVGALPGPDEVDRRKMTYVVPKKFSDQSTSGLEEQVPGKDAYDLKLTSR